MGYDIDINKIDLDKLRQDLNMYFYFELILRNPFGVSDHINLDKVSDDKLVQIAYENGINLNKYVKSKTR